MGSPVNVSANISVGFEDQFSVEACQAFAVVQKCAKEAFEVLESFPKSLVFGDFQGDISQFSQSVDEFESSIIRINKSLITSQEEVNQFGKGLESPTKFVDNFWESMKKADSFLVNASVVTIIIALTGLLVAIKNPTVALGLALGIVGLNILFVISLVNDFEESVRALEDQQLLESKISNVVSSLELLTNTPDFQFKVDLLDNASQPAKQLRSNIENQLSTDIVQKIKIVEERFQFQMPSFPKSGKPDMTFRISPKNSGTSFGSLGSFSDNALPDFLTGSTDLSGFGASTQTSIPKFSTGIERVPRDMLAMIHKNEAVLPSNRADDYRQGGANAITIQKLDVSFNVPNAINLENMGREQFRNFAFKLMEEIERLNRRIN